MTSSFATLWHRSPAVVVGRREREWTSTDCSMYRGGEGHAMGRATRTDRCVDRGSETGGRPCESNAWDIIGRFGWRRIQEEGLRFIESIESNIGTTRPAQPSGRQAERQLQLQLQLHKLSSTAGGAELPHHSRPLRSVGTYHCLSRTLRQASLPRTPRSGLQTTDEARSFDKQKIPRRPTLIGGGTFPLVLFPFSSNFYRYRYVIGRYFASGWTAGPGRALAGGGCGDGSGHGGSKSSRSWRWPSASGPVRMARRSEVGRLQW